MSRRRRRNRHKQPWASPQGGPRVPGGAASPTPSASPAKPSYPKTVTGATVNVKPPSIVSNSTTATVTTLTREDLLKLLTIDSARSGKPFGTVVFARAKGALVVACKAKSLPDAVELEQIFMGLMRQYCEAPKPVKGQAPPPMVRESEPIRYRTTGPSARKKPSREPVPGALETVSPTGYGNRNDDDVEAAIADGGGRRR